MIAKSKKTPLGARGLTQPDSGAQRYVRLAREVPADLRLPWTLIAAEESQHIFETGSVGWASQTRRWADRESRVVVDAPAALSVPEYLDGLLDPLVAQCGTDFDTCPALAIVLLLSLWDSEFRESELYGGYAFLASAQSVTALSEVTGWIATALSDPLALEHVLLGLADIDLLYYVPVALEFRGEFGTDRQLRLNSWGRDLAARLLDTGETAEWIAAAREQIRTHLAVHRQRYLRHMHVLAHLSDHDLGSAWFSAQDLPVGVLI